MSFTNRGFIVTVKKRKTKNKKVELNGSIASGVLFIGDCQFFAGSPKLELNNETGQVEDKTPVDPLNPFNTLDRTLDLVGDNEANLEIIPHISGRGVLINTHLQQGKFIVKKRVKDGKLIGISISIKG